MLAGITAGTAAQADAPAAWTRPHPPFHVVGPIDYVGTEGIGVYLIRTDAGLILLDGGPREAVPIVEHNIAKLGFKLSDVKIIIASHAHWDHAGGLAALKRDTGARFLASAADRAAYDAGTPPSDTDYGVVKFAPVKVDGVLKDGVAVRLGGVAITPVLTPGHTPGCTTWTMKAKDKARVLDVVFPCSLTVAGNKLIGNKGYPDIVRDFQASFARMQAIRADVTLPAHPEFADVLDRAKRRDAGEADAFVAPEVLPRLVSQSQAAFAQELARQEGQK
jgi:metallo-beta-lactamase class B